MPRLPVVTRFGVEPEVQEDMTELVDVLRNNSRVRLVAQDGTERVLPASLTDLLCRASEILSQGHDVDVLDASSDTLTPNEAADLIGISRPTLLKLIDEGVLTATRVPGSSHRRLSHSEVITFRDSRLSMQEQLNTSASSAQATGLFTRRPRK